MSEDQSKVDPSVDEAVDKHSEEIDQLSEEEKQATEAMVSAAAIANRLVAHNTSFGRLVASMLASRQLYAMCLYELEMLCDETNFVQATRVKDEPDLEVAKSLPDNQMTMLKEILINSAAVQAQQPFDENVLFNGMVDTVFPWMQEVVQKHTKLQQEQQKKQHEEIEKARVASEVSLGIQFNDSQEGSDGYRLARQKPVLFVGPRAETQWLMDYISKRSLDADNNISQLVRLSAGGKPQVQDPQFLSLSKQEWEGIASSNSGMQKLYECKIETVITNPVDVLLVDDLSHAYHDKSFNFAAITTIANEAQKRFKRWSKNAGCLLVGCLVLDRQLKANELNMPEFETLRMHNILRGVSSETVEQHGKSLIKINVGQFEVAVIDPEELESFAEKKIIQP